ncbi:MAG: apolipoprotein N-acyltransferase, partial [Spirochaetales bacterium]|nr:apolipoprotein N-acyltransferase [Spirochaetales bacterium]
IQIADITGVFGISWLIILVNLLFSKIIIQLIVKNSDRSLFLVLRYVLIICITFLIPLLYGTYKFNTLVYSPDNKLKVGFAQTLFHPQKAWEENKDDYMEVIDYQITMLAGLKSKLIIFPELTIDRFLTLDPNIRLEENEEILNGISLRAKENGVYILFGGLELANTAAGPDNDNSSFMFDDNGDLTDIYRKNILVPFGEKNPFGGLFPGIQNYIIETTDAIDLLPGDRSTIMEVEDETDSIKFGVLTCFESGFGQLGRTYAKNDADFLVNMTNDYWSLSSVAMKQHLVFSIFRAIEIRRPVLRISNGGYSGYVNEFGKFYSKIPIFQQGMMTANLRLPEDRKLTFYTRYGEWFLVVCLFPIFFDIFSYLRGFFKRIGMKKINIR